ncbi:hypothetical protein DITRI_Ditri01bG0039800 [Diplodiscus trichospermus]
MDDDICVRLLRYCDLTVSTRHHRFAEIQITLSTFFFTCVKPRGNRRRVFSAIILASCLNDIVCPSSQFTLLPRCLLVEGQRQLPTMEVSKFFLGNDDYNFSYNRQQFSYFSISPTPLERVFDAFQTRVNAPSRSLTTLRLSHKQKRKSQAKTTTLKASHLTYPATAT